MYACEIYTYRVKYIYAYHVKCTCIVSQLNNFTHSSYGV